MPKGKRGKKSTKSQVATCATQCVSPSIVSCQEQEEQPGRSLAGASRPRAHVVWSTVLADAHLRSSGDYKRGRIGDGEIGLRGVGEIYTVTTNHRAPRVP